MSLPFVAVAEQRRGGVIAMAEFCLPWNARNLSGIVHR
jgi:hypothetical protein